MPEPHQSPTRRDIIAAALAAVGGASVAAFAGASAALPIEDSTMAALPAPTGDIHDFDYHIGSWTMVNRKLKKRWVANPEWDEFPGTDRYVRYLDGLVNVDEAVFPTKGFSGLTMRVFDLGRRQWSIYWINSKGGALDAPMIGGFQGNLGVFYGDDVDDGRPVKARYLRMKQPPDNDRWEQAFSLDGGLTWETNWVADFTRSSA